MRWYCLALVVMVQGTLAVPASAGIFFHRQPNPNPAQRVQELIATLKTDLSESKREAAAEELRQFDPKAFPEIVPALIDALQQDAKASVRLEAAQSLGRLRPISQQAGKALEQALANDASMRVRWQARSSLWQYHLGGYHSAKNEESPSTKEPPLAPPLDRTSASNPLPPSPTRFSPAPLPTAPARPRPVAAPVSRPLPAGPAAASSPSEEGPELTPPG